MQKMRVNRSAQNNRIKKKQQEFSINFTHTKNIIEKQMFKGMMIKERRNITTENRKRKEKVKQGRVFINHQAIPNKVFDTSVSHPMIFNSFLDVEKESQNSTLYTGEKEYDTGQTSTLFGHSFINFPQYQHQDKTFDKRGKSQKT